MSYVALYRKARPSVFDDVRGQDHIVTTLKNQVMAGRIQHAYLFCGTRGTGKTSIAKIMAKVVNCENPVNGNPCNECASCRQIAAGNSMNVIEIDAASNNGVDNIREIVEEVRYRPTQGKYKVYIIDEVHMLSQGAFNALLKTLEEPPSYVVFILATTEVGKIPVTILSRCQRYDFHRIDAATLVSRMRELVQKEGVEAEERALQFIARSADGSMRDALSLLDQCIAFYMGEKITYEKALKALGAVDTDVFASLTASIIQGDAGSAVLTFAQMMERGREAGQFVSDYIWYLRNLLMVQTEEEAMDLVDAPAEQILKMQNLAGSVAPEIIMRYIRVLSELQNNMRFATNRRVLVEIAFIRLCRPQMERTEDSVRDRIRMLEDRLEEIEMNGLMVSPPDPYSYSAPILTDEKVETAPPPNAAPEDLEKVLSIWPQILENLDSGLLRGMLKDVPPEYKADGNDTRLYLRLKNFATKAMEHKDENVHNIETVLEKKIGKQGVVVLWGVDDKVDGLYKVTVSKNENVDDIFADRNKIAMEVEVTDEEWE
ncbi:MAG: DNA polymerase III subunit gamma/tau [Lachnospiraceae bacterium]|nr:DNA polymerase III subunit gamma/tau [Lachnospiraceae bacterium]